MERCQGARGSALTATAEMSQLQQYSHRAVPWVWSWASNVPASAPIPHPDTSSSHHGLTKPFSFMNMLKQCHGKPPALCPPHTLLNLDLGLVLPCSSPAPAGRDKQPRNSKGTSLISLKMAIPATATMKLHELQLGSGGEDLTELTWFQKGHSRKGGMWTEHRCSILPAIRRLPACPKTVTGCGRCAHPSLCESQSTQCRSGCHG